jgi:pimeloyl-ACP methyl ester carboxylesterase
MGITLSESYPVRLPAAARRRTLWTAGGRLAALEAAPAAPVPVRGVVVLLPGFTGSKEDFIPLLSPIAAAGYRVIGYDQRGQYESDGPARERAYSMELFARDLREVIGMVGDGGPVHLAGHSFGGLVARNLVIAEPALVRSLTLLDSGPAGTSLLRARWLGLLAGLIRLCGPAVFAALAAQAARWAGVPAGRLPWLRHRLVHTQRAGLVGMCQALSREPDRVDELASTPVPVLVICGEHDDAWSPKVQEEMARRLDAPMVIIKNAGHTPNEDQPEATAGAMLRFWDLAERRP